jgi:hypothetical protein
MVEKVVVEMLICEKCKAEEDDLDAKYCGECSAPFKKEPETKDCPNCQAKIKIEKKFCG